MNVEHAKQAPIKQPAKMSAHLKATTASIHNLHLLLLLNQKAHITICLH